MTNLNLKDQKILFLLSKNSKLPISELSKLTGLSRDIVKYRIDKLEHTGIIKGFKTIINYRKLGFEEFDVYLRTTNTTEQIQDKLVRSLCKNPNITWVGTCFGRYDLRISLLAKNNQDLSKKLNHIENQLSPHLQEYEITTVIKKFKIHPEILLSTLFPKIKGFKLPPKLLYQENRNEYDLVSLDEVDKIILKELGKNTRSTLVDLSNKVNLNPETISYRIKKLASVNLIKGYSVAIDGSKLDKIWSVFLFKISNLDNESEKRIEEYILNNHNVTSSVKLLGKWNWGITVYANNMKDIQKILFDVRNHFSDSIIEYNLLTIFDTYKYPAVAEGVFE